MADIKLKRGALTSMLTTELNALANGSGSAASAAYDNETNLETHAICELVVDFVSAPTAESVVSIYLIKEVDSAAYEDYISGASPVTPTNGLVGQFILKNTTAAQRIASNLFELPGCAFKVAVVNSSGQAFPASGSTVKMQTFYFQSV